MRLRSTAPSASWHRSQRASASQPRRSSSARPLTRLVNVSAALVACLWLGATSSACSATKKFLRETFTARPTTYRGTYDRIGLFQTGDEKPPRGLVLWKKKLGRRAHSEPLVDDMVVYAGSPKGTLHGLHVADGRKHFTFEAKCPIRSAPIAYREMIYVGCENGTIFGVDTESGFEKWKFDVGSPIRPAPILLGETLLVLGLDGTLISLGAIYGREEWRAKLPGPIAGSAAIEGHLLYAASKTTLFAFDLKKRIVVWRFRIGRPFVGTPAVAYQRVYIGAADGHVYSVHRETGKQIWKFKAEGAIHSTPAVFDRRVFIGCDDGHLYAINIADGKIGWRFYIGRPVRSAPIVVANRLYFGSDNRFFYSIGVDGKLRWKIETGGPITGSAFYRKGRLFFVSGDGYLYAIH